MYEELTRNQMATLVSFCGVAHDALIEHRDHSWTLSAGYWPGKLLDGMLLRDRSVERLTRYTKITVLDTRLVTRTRSPRVEIHFAIPKQEA